MQSCRLSPLFLSFLSLALLVVLTQTAPTELPDEENNIPLADPDSTDLAPALTTEDQPVWSGLGGWSSFIGALPRRRSSPGVRPPGSPRSGRRSNQQLQGNSRRRGEKTVFLPPALVSDEPEVSDSVEKVLAELSEGAGEGGRFGRGHGGRRGGKKKENVDSGESKPEGRRSGPRSDKNKAKDDTETEIELTTVEGTDEPCGDLLDTRAGPARDTVTFLLENIDNPDELRPILDDLEANVNGSQ